MQVAPNPKLRRVTNGHVTAVPQDESNSDFFLEASSRRKNGTFILMIFSSFCFNFFTEPGMHFG